MLFRNLKRIYREPVKGDGGDAGGGTVRKLQMESQRVNGIVRPGTVDLETRTVEIVFTTGQSGKRWHWDIGYYMEELEVSKAAIRTERLDKGLSIIDNHDRWAGTSGVHGITESYRIENGELIGTARFATDDDSDVVFKKVVDGVLRHVSLGYNVLKFDVKAGKGENELDTYRAVDWEPLELSIVPVSFETTNGIRSEKPSSEFLNDVNITGDNTMLFRNQSLKYHNPVQGDGGAAGGGDTTEAERAAAIPPVVAPVAPVATAPVVNATDIRAQLGIMRSAAVRVGLDETFAVTAYERGVSLQDFNNQILDELATRNAPKVFTNADQRSDHVESKRGDIEHALLARMGVEKHTDGSRAFAGATLLDLVRHQTSKQGENTLGLSSSRIAQRAFMSSSDFPLILENVMNKSLARGYEETPRTFLDLGQRATVNDFREKHTYMTGDAPELLPLGENGEYKAGSFGESKESYAIDTFARKLGFSRKMIINDDMSALDQVPRMFGAAGSRLESDVVWGLLLNWNFKTGAAAEHFMRDGKPLFHADHKNVLTGATSALSKDSLSALRILGRKMKTLDNNFMNVMWNTLVLPEELETTAEELLVQSIMANVTGNTNPFRGKLDYRVEPRLAAASTTAWLAFTNMFSAFEYAYLAGEEGMMTEVIQSTDADGMQINVRKDFGAGLVDFRAAAWSKGKA